MGRADELLEADPKSMRPKITQESIRVIQSHVDKKVHGFKVGIMSPGDVGGYGDTDAVCLYQSKQLLFKRYQIVDVTAGGVAGLVAHEVAHALTPGDGHGNRWKQLDRELSDSAWAKDLSLDLKKVRKRYEPYYLTFTRDLRGWTE